MKRRPGKMLLCILLSLALTTSAVAASPAAMTDIKYHWARDAIYYGMVEGLFNGVTETKFAPDDDMSRAMWVTVLGRIAGIDPAEYNDWYLEYLYDDVQPGTWYAPYVCWATRYGIANGTGDGKFSPDQSLSREQMATMTVRFASIYNNILSASGEKPSPAFDDADSVSSWAADAVESLRMTGILTGSEASEGTYILGPQESASRAQGAVLVSRLSKSMQPYTERTVVEPAGISVAPYAAELRIGDYTNLTATVSPSNATNQTVTWFSTDKSVATVQNGVVTALDEGTAEIYGYTYNGLYATCSVTVTKVQPPAVETPADTSLAYAGESYEDKCLRIFGYVPGGPNSGAWRDVYKTYSTGDTSHLVSVPVQVWDFTDGSHTEKYTKTIYLTVHKNIAATVQAIFQEIYEGPERFPISSAGGYYSSSGSEHDAGLAIDINPDSNYYCYPDGTAITGSHFDPENDPYSIPLDGDVVRAFEKYGFSRGINWRNGYKDYMHFSFFGW